MPLAAIRSRWAPWYLAAVIAVGSADLVVLAQLKAFLGSGYNGYALSSGSELVAFLALGAACDGALVALLWAAAALALRPFCAPPRRTALGLLIATGVPVAIDVAIHRLHATLGDVLALDIVLGLATGDELGALSEVLAQLPSFMVLAAGAAAAIAALAWGSKWLADFVGPGHRTRTERMAGLCVALLLGMIALRVGQENATLRFGLSWKPSGITFGEIANRLTDFDADGSGALALPTDAAPFDSDRHPFAREIAGNGVDENGLAGDLPASSRPTAPIPAVRVERTSGSPDVVVLLLLESFRADLIGARLDGREITPQLNALARDGVTSAHAVTHNASTWASRTQLLQGTVRPQRDRPTLVDDFASAGFTVAWFSGQHDGLKDGRDYLGFDRAHVFTDARAHLEQRTSRSARPISLQTSWQTVLADIEHFLGSSDGDAPLFLYVNLTDTHFPYDHGQLEPIFTRDRLDRGDITRENRDLVWRAYANAAANVDRGVGRLRALLESRYGRDRIGLLVTADHGQAFYEDRFLGHGQSFDRRQVGVPMIVLGLGGAWPEPIALSDVRGLLTRAASTGDRSARFVPDPERALLHFAGPIERPRLIGLRTLAGVTQWSPQAEEPGDSTDFTRLIHAWEASRAAGS